MAIEYFLINPAQDVELTKEYPLKANKFLPKFSTITEEEQRTNSAANHLTREKHRVNP